MTQNLLDWAAEHTAHCDLEQGEREAEREAEQAAYHRLLLRKRLAPYSEGRSVTEDGEKLVIDGVAFLLLPDDDELDVVRLGVCPECGETTVSERLFSSDPDAFARQLLTFQPHHRHGCPARKEAPAPEPETDPYALALAEMPIYGQARIYALLAIADALRAISARLDHLTTQRSDGIAGLAVDVSKPF